MHGISAQVQNVGFAFLPSYLPGKSSEDVAHSIGAAVCVGKGGSVHQLKPKPESDGLPTTYSGMYGGNIFPLHTDSAHWRFPPRFLLLRCVTGYEAVATLLIDGVQVIENIDPICNEIHECHSDLLLMN
jgi:L-asparagine oxygenase